MEREQGWAGAADDAEKEYAAWAGDGSMQALSKSQNRSSGPMLESGDRSLSLVRLGVPRGFSNDPEVTTYVADMKRIGQLEGFQVVVEYQDDAYIEDHRVILSENGKEVWLISCQNTALVALAGERAGLSQVTERTGNPAVAQATADSLGVPTRQARGYYEGGNLLTTMLNGKKVVLIGDNTVRMNQELFEMQGSGNARSVALQLIARDLGVGIEQLVVVPQASETRKPEWWWSYGAVDMLIRPGADGDMFVSDPSATEQFLQQYRLREDPGYQRDFDAKLGGYGNQALADAQRAVLEQAGFRVIPFPGEVLTFFDYANGLMATGNQGRYFITNRAAKWPALDGAFADFMQRFGYTVHFVHTGGIVSRNKGGIDCMTSEVAD